MPKIRLFTPHDLTNGSILPLTESNIHYLSKVMRKKEGDQILLFNGRDGEWICNIGEMGKKSGSANAVWQTRPQKNEPDIWLCFAMVKNTPMSNILQKATELGAAKLQPVITEYTNSDRFNANRAEAIILEAAEQSERLTIPEIADPVTFKKLLEDWDKGRKIILCDESGSGSPAVAALTKLTKGKYAIFTGPEGGFSKTEFEILRKHPYIIPIGMGPRILRADTAAIAALACCMSVLGDWDEPPHFEG